jgi:hypothetical protein
MFELQALVSTGVVFFIGWTCLNFIRKKRAKRCAGIGGPDRYRDDLNRYAVGEAAILGSPRVDVGFCFRP